MVRVFGENFADHPLDADLDGYVTGDPPASLLACLGQSVCMNIREDHWIPSVSRDSFLRFRQARGTLTLEDCLTRYHRRQVQSKAEFKYADRLEPKNPGELLVRVFNLSGVFDPLDRFRRSREFKAWSPEDRKVFREFPDGYSEWLSFRMQSPDFERSLDLILKALTIQEEKRPYRPCWVVSLSEFRKRVTGQQDWWRVVGIQPPRAGDWLVLLAHREDEISPRFQPCQFFAGWYGCHYPAPKGARSGYAMEILCKDTTTAPLEEYITGEIAPDLEHWKAAGSIRPWQAGITPYSVDDHLRDRVVHSVRLNNVV